MDRMKIGGLSESNSEHSVNSVNSVSILKQKKPPLRTVVGKTYAAQAFAAGLALTFTLAAAVFRLLYAFRRFRFSTLLYCLPIIMNLYFIRALRLCNSL
jgi:hypothetical protein